MLWDFIKDGMRRHSNQFLYENGVQLRYEQVIERAESLAETLQKKRRYAILCGSEMNAALSILACLAAEAVAVPLSDRYGAVHAQRIVSAVCPDAILTDGHGKITCAVLDQASVIQEDMQDVCLILCTSGTTGIPKGAMITQDNIKANVLDIARYFPICERDSILIMRPLYHCAVLTGEFLIGLLKGANLYFLSEAFNPVKTTSYLQEHPITVMGGTPTLFFHLVHVMKRCGGHGFSLNKIVISGECLSQRAAGELIQYLPRVDKYSVYGLTEASPRVSFLPPGEFDSYFMSVGYPLFSVKVKLVDDSGEQVESNKVGELLVRGPNVMKGYFGDPAATKQRLAEGWLHTGDLAYRDDLGHIFIKGRKDQMIIRGGVNIYPLEIENALRQSTKIKEVMAYGFQDPVISQGIGLKVVPEGMLDQNEIHQICRRYLPDYELPNVIELVDVLPQNASGKLTRGGF